MTKKIKRYEVDSIREFDKNVDYYVAKKRFKKLPSQIMELQASFSEGIFASDTVIKIAKEPTPYEIYKLRLPVPDINVGKSNGYRLIYLVATEMQKVLFMSLYYKKDYPTVSDKHIDDLVNKCLNGLLNSEK